jgi:hypothetical protein
VGPRACLDTQARGKILSPLPEIVRRSPGLSYSAHTYCTRGLKTVVWSESSPTTRSYVLSFISFLCHLHSPYFVLPSLICLSSCISVLFFCFPFIIIVISKGYHFTTFPKSSPFVMEVDTVCEKWRQVDGRKPFLC